MTIRTASLREDTGGNVVEDNLSVRFHTTPRNILISVALAAGSCPYGYTTNVISGALALPSFNEQFLAIDAEAKIGGMLGVSVHYAMFIVARFIAGFGSSIAFTVAPVFIIAEAVGLKDRVDEASKILHRLHQSRYDPSGVIARAELVQITQQLDATKTLERGYKHIFTTPSLRKRAYCMVLVWFSGMSTGVLVIANLTPLLFAGLGYGSTIQFGLSTAWLVCCILAASVGGLMVDKLGRVLFMILGLTSCAAVMAVETAIQAEYLESTNKHAHAAGVAFYFFFAILYNVFYDAGSFVYTVEIWPNHLRSEGMTIAMVTFYITNIIWNSSATVAMRSIKWGYYPFFVIIPIISSVVLWYMLPETKGLALGEIGEKFGEEPQTRRIQDIAMSKETDDLEPTKEIGEA